ncbi:hypothetical protein M422DRAFT_273736 [Sphaerobolus stellatus SS14]|uniref:Uncharacterized protein n=1 Tax=Sphaerobolus stellatus (strain SS14) TaxID=990650 RepID=A0A0C9T8H5_SPHS4|nr:hypothetical protein M422DRAFT_273736 [Sphaerobolus stellatus SS14]
MSSISFIYAGLALRHFLHHRITFATHLKNAQSSISPTKFFHLMALAIVEMA